MAWIEKTRASVRRIFIQPELAEMLAEFRKWRALDIMATGLRPAAFFYSRTGGLYYEHLFNKILPREIHPHMVLLFFCKKKAGDLSPVLLIWLCPP